MGLWGRECGGDNVGLECVLEVLMWRWCYGNVNGVD